MRDSEVPFPSFGNLPFPGCGESGIGKIRTSGTIPRSWDQDLELLRIWVPRFKNPQHARNRESQGRPFWDPPKMRKSFDPVRIPWSRFRNVVTLESPNLGFRCTRDMGIPGLQNRGNSPSESDPENFRFQQIAVSQDWDATVGDLRIWNFSGSQVHRFLGSRAERGDQNLPSRVARILPGDMKFTDLAKFTWLVLGEDPAARSHRVEQFTAL